MGPLILRNMRPFLLLSIVLFVLLGGAIPHAVRGQDQVLVNQFVLSSEGADVLLTWELLDEAGIEEYRLFRRINQEPTAAHVATLPANQAGLYTYLDDDIFKNKARVIMYELHIVTEAKVHRFTRSLSHNPTSVQRTWGSIKAMFRY